MDKASFVLYTDYKQHIDLLSLEEKGLLLESIFCYVNGQELPPLSGMAKMAFSFIKSGLDRDAEKYELICDKRRQAANKRWDMQKDANASKSIISNAMHYDSVSDTDSDNETDNGIGNGTDTVQHPTPTAPSLSEVEEYYRAYCDEYGYEFRPDFPERFLMYRHPDYWQGDIDKWVKQDQEKRSNKNLKSFQNFASSDTNFDDLFYKMCANNQI